MAEFQIAERYSLPRDIDARSSDDTIEPRMDDALSDCLPDDRLVARSQGIGVVVCVPRVDYPRLNNRGAQYTNISTRPFDQTVDDMAAALDAVESMLDPLSGPTSCHYSVRTKSIQLSSNTPERFLTDLQEVTSIATEVEERSPIRTPSVTEEEVIGACVWPTRYGTFYLKAHWLDDYTTANVQYGILAHETPLDTTPIEAFFDEFDYGTPPYQAPWPYRQLTLRCPSAVPITLHESLDDIVVTARSDRALKLTRGGENPLYRTVLPGDAFSNSARQEIYYPLRATSTLAYQKPQVDESGPYVLDTIYALDPPVDHLCIVSTSLDCKPER